MAKRSYSDIAAGNRGGALDGAIGAGAHGCYATAVLVLPWKLPGSCADKQVAQADQSLDVLQMLLKQMVERE